MQEFGEHYWDTYSPVVQMQSIRLMLILSLVLGMKTRSIDFTLAYTQAPIDTEMYIEVPAGFEVDGEKGKYVLKLRKNLYGLKQAGLNWYETLQKYLKQIGFKQSAIDPCCYYRNGVVLLCYIDDCLIFSHDETKIQKVISELGKQFNLTDEGDVATYLGIDIKKLTSEGHTSYALTQPFLIQRIISTLGLKDSRLHDTPAEPKTLLHKDTDGQARKYDWSYRSVIGMLNYLCGTRPELLFAVHQCSRFCNDPKLSHEQAVKRIVRYLKRTPNDGIILSPDAKRGIQCFVDADFAAGWHQGDAADPSSVYSRTGYVIMFAGCPVIWVSKLQTEIALSTTEAEYIALSQAMRDLIPFISLVEEVSKVLKFQNQQPEVSWKSCGFQDGKFSADLYEDNRGALELAKAPKMRPRTKHIALKYHHFRSKVEDGTVRINAISTKEQVADMFTKALPRDQFVYLRKHLCGW